MFLLLISSVKNRFICEINDKNIKKNSFQICVLTKKILHLSLCFLNIFRGEMTIVTCFVTSVRLYQSNIAITIRSVSIKLGMIHLAITCPAIFHFVLFFLSKEQLYSWA
jgi:hypothetical protein